MGDAEAVAETEVKEGADAGAVANTPVEEEPSAPVTDAAPAPAEPEVTKTATTCAEAEVDAEAGAQAHSAPDGQENDEPPEKKLKIEDPSETGKAESAETEERQPLERLVGASRDTQPAWMTKGMGIGTEMFGEATGELIKPGVTKKDLEEIEKRGVPDGPDPFGEVFRESKEDVLASEVDQEAGSSAVAATEHVDKWIFARARFGDPAEAKRCADELKEIDGTPVTCRLLEGEEENEFWQALWKKTDEVKAQGGNDWGWGGKKGGKDKGKGKGKGKGKDRGKGKGKGNKGKKGKARD